MILFLNLRTAAQGTITYIPLHFEWLTNRRKMFEFRWSDNTSDVKQAAGTPAREKQISLFWDHGLK